MIGAKAVAQLRWSRQAILREGATAATDIHVCMSRAAMAAVAERHRRVAAGCAVNIGTEHTFLYRVYIKTI